MKFFSVEWMAQSHHDEVAAPAKPHIPCLAQPRQPSYGKGYLQPKPKTCRASPEPASHDLDAPKCASPISDASGYSSGYESEATSSECPSVDEKEESPQRRVRTKFTPEQIRKLEKIFNKHKYLDASEREKTAIKLELSETQVRTWFQNRRMKLKREVQDMNAQIPPVLFHHHLTPPQYHDVRAHYSPGYFPLPQMALQQPRAPLMIPHYY
ncbi:homeobox protein vent1-like [Neosynchiropus ocellatus]